MLLHEPELLFLDEPFTGLDLDARDLLCDVLREAHQRGTTLLMSTHDMSLGLSLCSSAIVLVRGRIAWTGPAGAADAVDFEARYRELTQQRTGATAPPTAVA